ncbi:4Fe-4S binding protein [Duganella alba]|uniref:4Fe-4S binding protein n=1 Tax=Duganella alba TaxID=2666081 RepID=UPI00353147EC
MALTGIVASAFFSSEITDKLVELEPFKTAITLNFVRSWPYVVYAVGLLLASSVVYKFFCRYLCPFGASLALLGRIRLLNWIPRYGECGTPCQTCRHRCDYQAIAPSGKVDYAECFQCMDCVVIYASDQQCALRITQIKRQRTIPIQPVARSEP